MPIGATQNGSGTEAKSQPATPTTTTSTIPAVILCPYCGHRQCGHEECEACKGFFDPLSRQATQNQMGPWFIRNEKNPFAPGMSYDRIRLMAMRGRIKPDTILRGPSTRQFWTLARNAPGVASLIGECHNCHAPTEPDEYLCRSCGVILSWSSERQHMGLSPVKLLPGEAHPAEVASSGMGGGESRPSHPTPTRASPALSPPPASAPAPAPIFSTHSRSQRRSQPAWLSEKTADEPPQRKRSNPKIRRKDPHSSVLLAVGIFSAVVVVGSLIAVFGFGVGVPHDRAVTSAAKTPSATVQTPALAPPPPSPASDSEDDAAPAGERAQGDSPWFPASLRPALDRWWVELEEARRLAQAEESAPLSGAVAIVERVLAEARAAGSLAPEALTALEHRAEALRARADAVRLRELLGDSPTPSR